MPRERRAVRFVAAKPVAMGEAELEVLLQERWGPEKQEAREQEQWLEA